MRGAVGASRAVDMVFGFANLWSDGKSAPQTRNVFVLSKEISIDVGPARGSMTRNSGVDDASSGVHDALFRTKSGIDDASSGVHDATSGIDDALRKMKSGVDDALSGVDDALARIKTIYPAVLSYEMLHSVYCT